VSEQIRFLAENRSVDVIVCVMPNEMFDSITTSEGDDDDNSGENELEHNFRRILKAKSMRLGTLPTNLVWNRTGQIRGYHEVRVPTLLGADAPREGAAAGINDHAVL
jgi:hypothetical protein